MVAHRRQRCLRLLGVGLLRAANHLGPRSWTIVGQNLAAAATLTVIACILLLLLLLLHYLLLLLVVWLALDRHTWLLHGLARLHRLLLLLLLIVRVHFSRGRVLCPM